MMHTKGMIDDCMMHTKDNEITHSLNGSWIPCCCQNNSNFSTILSRNALYKHNCTHNTTIKITHYGEMLD